MWDDDDFDPTAQLNERVADAVAVVGIVDEVKKEPEPEKPSDKQKPPKQTNAAPKVHKELSKAEIEELQKRRDMELFAGVLGVEVEKPPQTGDSSTDQQFEALAEEIKEKEKAVKTTQKPTPQPKQQKKKVDTAVYDDYVDDELDTYDDKFADYY